MTWNWRRLKRILVRVVRARGEKNSIRQGGITKARAEVSMSVHANKPRRYSVKTYLSTRIRMYCNMCPETNKSHSTEIMAPYTYTTLYFNKVFFPFIYAPAKWLTPSDETWVESKSYGNNTQCRCGQCHLVNPHYGGVMIVLHHCASGLALINETRHHSTNTVNLA